MGGRSLIIRRLMTLYSLSETAIGALDVALDENINLARAGQDLIHEGDQPDFVRMILSGWCCRHKILADGRRQIIGFVLPGDICDTNIFQLSEMDHSLSALTAVSYAKLGHPGVEALMADDPSIARSFAHDEVLNLSIQREWTVSLGRRTAFERIAHLFCELFERLQIVGLVENKSYAFPVTQLDIAAATGLSGVHVNRTLQELRASGLVMLREKTLTINDLEGLKNAAFFDPRYLYPAKTSQTVRSPQ